MINIKDFDYNLPPEAIAQHPAKPRDHARLLCLDKKSGQIRHNRFDEIVNFLQAGDVLVINDSKVFPARILARKKLSGGKVEILLHRHLDNSRWECLIGGKVKPGIKIDCGRGLEAEAISDQGDGTWLVDFNLFGANFWSILEKIGKMPLPPYIKEKAGRSLNRQRYQTVYADDKKLGSAAAPTAGLHFTKRLLDNLKAKGVILLPVTLHVGLGTFAPLREENIKEKKLHSELISINRRVAKVLAKAREEKRRIIAVGTTSCRVLETYAQEIISGRINWGEAYQGWTDIFIYPGYKFALTEAMITNFHLPKSSLLMLVSAFAGKKNIERAYQEALSSNYRFYSYGDAMFIS